MGWEPRLIAPFDGGGLIEYYKPWLIGEKAFSVLEDAYSWRGVVRKREGFTLLATLPNNDKPIQGISQYYLNNSSTNAQETIVFSKTKAYLLISTPAFQDITFYAYATGGGSPVTGAAFSFNNSSNFFFTSNYASSLWTTNNDTTDHIKYWNGTNGVVNVSGGWSTFQPIISGTTTLDAALMILPYKGRLVALNTFENGNRIVNRARWSQIGTPYAGAASPTSISSFSAANPTTITSANHGLTAGDPISFINVTGTNAANFNLKNLTVATRVDANNFTVALDGTGTSGGFVQLMGVPPSPFVNDINAWRDEIPGKGGFNDADTNERIVSAAIIKDILIVFFEKSSWRLRYTGNEVLPFIWERINTQYGSESTLSTITFDERALTFSRYGFIESDTQGVQRIDEKIPDQTFFKMLFGGTASSLQNVQGIRDYYRQTAYWCYEDVSTGTGTNNKVLAYNYLDKTFARFNQPFRCFGYYKQFFDLQWQNAKFSWASANFPWEGDEQQQFPLVVAGDVSNGNVYVVYDLTENAQDETSISISNITAANPAVVTLSSNNIFAVGPVTITNVTGTMASSVNNLSFTPTILSPTTFSIPVNTFGLTYTGSGNVTGPINFGFDIQTQRFNPYISQGQKGKLGYVDIYATLHPGSEITLNLYVDDQDDPVISKTVEVFSRGVQTISSIIPGVSTTTITTSQQNSIFTGLEVTLGSIVGSIGNVLNNNTFVATKVDNFTFTIPVDTNFKTYTSGGYVYDANLPAGDAKYTRIYLGAIAHMFEIELTLTNDQINDPVKGLAQFEMQGIVIWTRSAGRIRG